MKFKDGGLLQFVAAACTSIGHQGCQQTWVFRTSWLPG